MINLISKILEIHDDINFYVKICKYNCAVLNYYSLFSQYFVTTS